MVRDSPQVKDGEATRNLRLMMVRCPSLDIDPNSPIHVEAYQLLRQSQSRIRPEQFVAFMKSREHKVSAGNKVRCAIWAVPKQNFPGDLPADILENIVPEEDLLANAEGTKMDWSQYWPVDQAVERKRLGRDVRSVEWSVKDSKVYKAPTGDSMHAEQPPPETPCRAEEPPPVTPCRAPPVTPCMQSPTGDSAASAAGTTPTPRCLKRGLSAESDSEEVDAKRLRLHRQAMVCLRENIIKASAQNQWYSKDPLNCFHVHAWSLAVLEGAEAANAESQKGMLSKFCIFLSKLMLDAACFQYVGNFNDVFQRLTVAEIEFNDEALFVARMSMLSEDSDELDWAGLSYEARIRLRGSALVKDFIERRVRRRLQKAKESMTYDERMKHLRTILEIPDVPEAVKKIATAASVLFDAGLPVTQRIEYLLSDASHTKLVLDWDAGDVGLTLPSSELALIARLGCREPNWQDITADDFGTFCECVDQARAWEAMQHPVVKECMMFYKRVRSLCKLPSQCRDFVVEVCGSRLCLGWSVAESQDYFALPTSVIVEMYKPTKEFLGQIAEGSMVSALLEDMKEVMDKDKIARAKKRQEEKAKREEEDAKTESQEAVESTAGEVAAEEKAEVQIGDIVVTTSKKHKDSFDNQKAMVDTILSKDYKVTLLSGDKVGTTHKFQKDKVRFHRRPEPSMDEEAKEAEDEKKVTGGKDAKDEEKETNDEKPMTEKNDKAKDEKWQSVEDIFA